MTETEILIQEARWKSDVDKKLDFLVTFHEEQREFILMLREREVRRARLQEAVIQKSVGGLILMGIVGLSSLVWTGIKTEFGDILAFLRRP